MLAAAAIVVATVQVSVLAGSVSTNCVVSRRGSMLVTVPSIHTVEGVAGRVSAHCLRVTMVCSFGVIAVLVPRCGLLDGGWLLDRGVVCGR